jgi:hypothetical protein
LNLLSHDRAAFGNFGLELVAEHLGAERHGKRRVAGLGVERDAGQGAPDLLIFPLFKLQFVGLALLHQTIVGICLGFFRHIQSSALRAFAPMF